MRTDYVMYQSTLGIMMIQNEYPIWG